MYKLSVLSHIGFLFPIDISIYGCTMHCAPKDLLSSGCVQMDVAAHHL